MSTCAGDGCRRPTPRPAKHHAPGGDRLRWDLSRFDSEDGTSSTSSGARQRVRRSTCFGWRAKQTTTVVYFKKKKHTHTMLSSCLRVALAMPWSKARPVQISSRAKAVNRGLACLGKLLIQTHIM